MKLLIGLIVIWAIVVYGYEFRLLRRPSLAIAKADVNESPAPALGLSNVSFACASQRGFVSAVQVGKGMAVSAECASGFTEATTRCSSLLPMAGFGEMIKCAEPEAIHCHGGPLQVVGLFKDDSFCGDVSDRDLGPPEEAPRADGE